MPILFQIASSFCNAGPPTAMQFKRRTRRRTDSIPAKQPSLRFRFPVFRNNRVFSHSATTGNSG